jgi:hypothetical protein
MAEAPPPRVKSRRSYSRVKIFLMLGDGVTSSSKSSAADVPSHNPHPIRNALRPTPSSSCESSARANGHRRPSSPYFGRNKLKPPDIP